MNISTMTGVSVSRRQHKRLLLLAVLGTTTMGLATGCQSLRPRSLFSDPAPLHAAPRIAETPPQTERGDQKATEGDVSAPATPGDTPGDTPAQADVVNPVGYTDEVDPIDAATSPSDTLTSFTDLISQNENLQTIGSGNTSGSYPSSSIEPSGGITLDVIESIALSNNPTIAELVATTQKAAGFKTQVGLRANPTVGYNANQLADANTDQHTVYISQTIITADKLALNRNVLNEALRAQLFQLEAQKYRVATDIRTTFYAALAAQRRVSLISDFQSVADKGLELAELRKKGQEGSQLDVVQAEVQKNEIDLLLQQAEIQFQAAWREMAALAGNPGMQPEPLIGELPAAASDLDWQDVAATMVTSSPEYQAARARVTQARANVSRQEIQKIPNLNVNLGAGSDRATGEGLINFSIGAPIPVFNKNQGNISAALAEYIRACREVERVENSIRARLAEVSNDYGSSRVAVERYSHLILPNAAESLELAEIAYKAGETSFVQVLVARRTYFDTNLRFVAAQRLLAQSRARVDGYVLTGALNAVIDGSGSASLRGQTLSQQ
ncbi:TolC family protein [Allorhodopirellula solitaria]|uniref:TolC family protein n=1 Tax=Allorhodopirellula solitaria TaxID=2527987 RepID=UPI001FE6748D|nr:TolC family protein [Allorhodopirellula solitaria]